MANDSHLRGDTMNDIYAYAPDTEEEADEENSDPSETDKHSHE